MSETVREEPSHPAAPVDGEFDVDAYLRKVHVSVQAWRRKPQRFPEEMLRACQILRIEGLDLSEIPDLSMMSKLEELRVSELTNIHGIEPPAFAAGLQDFQGDGSPGSLAILRGGLDASDYYVEGATSEALALIPRSAGNVHIKWPEKLLSGAAFPQDVAWETLSITSASMFGLSPEQSGLIETLFLDTCIRTSGLVPALDSLQVERLVIDGGSLDLAGEDFWRVRAKEVEVYCNNGRRPTWLEPVFASRPAEGTDRFTFIFQ